MIKIILADDSQVLIDGMQTILKNQSKIKIIGTANNSDELLHLIEQTAPDILMMEVKFGEEKGFVTAKMIRKKYPEIKMIFLSYYQNIALIKNSFSLGAKAYLVKNISKKELVSSINMVYKGEVDFFYKKGPVK